MSININDKKFNKRKRKKRKGIEIEDYARENNINLNICLDYENSPEKVIKTDSHINSNESPKFDSLLEVQGRLKKRINDLTGQVNTYKYGKKLPTDFEEQKIEIETNTVETQQVNNHKCNTFQRYIHRKMNKKIGEVIETTQTAQISYKRKTGGNNQ